MVRSDEYDTAEMLKRLQRQVSSLRGGGTDEAVTIFQKTSDTCETSDTVEFSEWGYRSLAGQEMDIDLPSSVTTAMNDGAWSLMFYLKPEDQDNTIDDWPDYLGSNIDSWRVEDLNGTDTAGPHSARLYVDDDSASGAAQKFVGAIPHTEGEVYTGGYTVDATATGGTVLSYKDGVQVDSRTHPGKDNQSTFRSDPQLQLGHDALTYTVDRIDFYDRALSETEVEAWHNGAYSGDGLIFSLRLNEGPGGVPTDAVSGNAASPNEGTYEAPLTWQVERGFAWGVDKFSQKSW